MSQSHRRKCVVSPINYYANKQADDVTRCALMFMGNTRIQSSQVIYKSIHHLLTIRFLYLDDIFYDNWHCIISTHKGNLFKKNVTKREKHFEFVDTLSGSILENLSAIVCYSSEVRR